MNILSLNPWRVKRFTKQACRENVVASFFPLKIFIPLCFNVLSTVPCENRLADSLYVYIYVYVAIFPYHSARYVVESDMYWVREKTYIYQNESRFYINLKHPIMRMKTDLIVHFDSQIKVRPINNSSRWHCLKITQCDRNPWSWSSVKRQVCLSQLLTTEHYVKMKNQLKEFYREEWPRSM